MSERRKEKAARAAYSINRAAKRMSLGRNGVYDALNSGLLKGRKFNNRTIILHDEMIEFLKALPFYRSHSNVSNGLEGSEGKNKEGDR